MKVNEIIAREIENEKRARGVSTLTPKTIRAIKQIVRAKCASGEISAE